MSDDTVREFSPISYLADGVQFPPMRLSRAGLDRPGFNSALKAFVSKAVARTVMLDFLNHPTGYHAFDVIDNVPRSHTLVRRTLAFMKEHG